MKLEADDIRDIKVSPPLKGWSLTVSARQLVRAEMATKVVRHAVAVTPDTCFHEKGRFKVNKHQSRNTFN